MTARATPCLQVLDHAVWISLVDWAVRPARLRTSSATTANLRPCSPARAASDGGVEGQQVGLPTRRCRDDVEDVANLAAHGAHVANHLAGLLQLARELMGGGDVACHTLRPISEAFSTSCTCPGVWLAAWATSRTEASIWVMAAATEAVS